MVKHLDLSKIAQTPPFRSLVFSTDPNSLELPLNGVDEALQTFIEQEDIFEKVISQTKFPSAVPDPDNFVGNELGRPNTQARPYRIVVRTDVGDSGFGVLVYVVDRDGHIIAQDGRFVDSKYDFAKHRTDEQKVRGKMKEGVGLGPIAQEEAFYVIPALQENRKPLSDAAREFYLNPEENDPLSDATSDVVLGLAAQDGVNAVFLPTDFGETWSYIATRGAKTDYDLFQQVLHRIDDTIMSEDDQWLIGKPADPINAAATRFPREPYDELMKSIERDHCITIEDAGTFELNTNPGANRVFLNYYIPSVFLTQYTWIDFPNATALSLLGTLNDSEWKTAKTDKLRIPGGQFTSDQITQIAAWLTNDLQGLATMKELRTI